MIEMADFLHIMNLPILLRSKMYTSPVLKKRTAS